MTRKCNLGFTLIETVIALGVSSTVLTMFFLSMNQTFSSKLRIEAMLAAQSTQLDIMDRVSEMCSAYNTVSYASNGAKLCLETGNCSGIVDKSIQFVDSFGEVIKTINYNNDGTACKSKDSICDQVGSISLTMSCTAKNSSGGLGGGDSCNKALINYKLLWEVKSGDTKVHPWRAADIPLLLPRVYKSCQEANDLGEVVDGLYWVDTDGFGGRCPVQIYCKMFFKSGRALVANAPSEDYSDLPEVEPPLTPAIVGQLKLDLVSELVKGSKDKRSILVLNTPGDGDLSINLEIKSFDSFKQVKAEPTNCSELNENFEPVEKFKSSQIHFYMQNSEGKSMGYSQKEGFYCNSCGAGFCGVFPLNCCKPKIRGQLYVL